MNRPFEENQNRDSVSPDGIWKFETDTPENLGIPSEAVLGFIEHLERRKLCMHSIMILRHDRIAAEAHYPPFTGDSPHRMFSSTKTFVSMAVGLLIDEGKISLRSRMADFFPEYLPENIHPYTAEMTVRDLLLMATPYEHTTYTVKDPDWARTFYTARPSHRSGTVFNYDTSGTVALNALVEKLSGQNLLDYLRPRLLDPLGFSPGVWCVERPEGGAWGGSGLVCSVHELARFGLFLLHRGNWQGRQLVSASYMAEATSPLIDNRVSTSTPETQFGYGYQIWCTRHGGYGAYGMGSQLAVCLPEKDILLVTTADTQSIQGGHDIILDAFWTGVYPRIEKGKLSENGEALAKLRDKLGRLEFPALDGEASSPRQKDLDGGNYLFDGNPMKITRVRFGFTGDQGCMKYSNATGDHEIRFGLGNYLEGSFPETHYFGGRIGVPSGRGFRYKASGAWFNPSSLTIYLYIIDFCLGTLKINACFGEAELTLHMSKTAEWFLDEYNGMASGKRE
ncbi:MAG: beta-lactamase family protein [Treponema sp.]|jgi:CubicO group peptidase (beta-lactamase class C family)|nr:beta-lactamase family protein [Treponema sp.]